MFYEKDTQELAAECEKFVRFINKLRKGNIGDNIGDNDISYYFYRPGYLTSARATMFCEIKKSLKSLRNNIEEEKTNRVLIECLIKLTEKCIFGILTLADEEK